VAIVRSVEVLPRSGPRPAIRLRPVPQCDPPFDDELSPEVWAPTHQPAFDWPRREQHRPFAARHPAGEPQRGDPLGADDPALVAGASGDAKLAVRRFVSMCVEVLNGYRPATHLRRLALPVEAAGVVAQAIAGARRVAELRRTSTRAENAVRAAERRRRRPEPVGVLRLRLCEPRPGAVEATVLLVTGERTWAMAIRLELHRQSWAATVLRVI
jgi:hypothetical protein